ncbi:hypothetical protein ACF068_14665 [Streptomyces sp. NPDC016309]|uniref:hypothetical protein n=1 Tax=Streptomyces sp. NPDC016309 TaxID=3364965 RepID=UPI0036F7663E
MTAVLLLAALAVGYTVGRLRPWDRLDTWVWRRMTFMGEWTKSRPQQLLTVAVHVLVRPRLSWNIWRHRHDPLPPKSPPVRIRRAPEDES